MIYLIHGENQYESWHAVGQLVKDFLKKNPNGEIERYDDNNTNFSLSSLGFFDKPRLRLIKRFFKMPKNVQEGLWAELEQLKDLDVVFWENKAADKRTKIYKSFNKQHVAREFKFLKNAGLKKWVEQTLKKNKIQSTDKLVRFLTFRYATDQYKIESEINKLRLYLEGKNRTEILDEDYQVFSTVEGFDVWSFVENFFAKKKKQVLEVIENLSLDNREEIMIIGSLSSNLRPIYLYSKFGPRADAISKNLGIHPFVLSKAKGYARNFTLSRIERLYEQLLNLDYAFKRGEIDPKLGLGLLVASL